MSVIVFIIVVAVVIVVVRKSKSRSAEHEVSQVTYETAELPSGATADFSDNPVLVSGLNKLRAVVSPDKYGDYNDCKKVGKTIGEINEEVSAILQPGSPEYVEYFHSLYRAVIGSMLSSPDDKMREAIAYTLNQRQEWLQTGKCQTFVKGLSEDPLVADAEVIMTACEKCWFGNLKTTMWRKDMEKFNLPESV